LVALLALIAVYVPVARPPPFLPRHRGAAE
jgi:hypothetical protein